ncbi:MAG: FHA domain-containing protein [Planctomycetota bacterium]|nr:MAG: FHA domain-containing protein [Planctomycetota bacterium]
MGNEPALIGRHEAAEIHLTDPKVSTHHGQVLPSEKGFTLVDLNSETGLFINGKKIKKAQLKENMVITLGNTNIRVLKGITAEADADVDVEEISLDGEEPELSESTMEDVPTAKSKSKKPAKSKSKPSPSPKDSSLVIDDPFEDDEKGPFPSQAAFEALRIQGIDEKPSAFAILSMAGGVLAFFLLLMGIYAFLSKIFLPRSPDPRSPENQVANWSFERLKNETPLHWTLQGLAFLDKFVALGGKNSIRIEGDSKKPGRLISQKIVLLPGKQYYLKFFLQNQGAIPFIVALKWSHEGRRRERVDYPAILEDKGDWKEKSFYCYPPSWADSLQLEFFTLADSGRAWIDRVILEERDPKETEEEEPLLVDLDKKFLAVIENKGILWLYHQEKKMAYLKKGQFQINDSHFPSLLNQRVCKIIKDATFSKGTVLLEGKIFLPSQQKWLSFIQRIHQKPQEIQCIFEFPEAVDFYYFWEKPSRLPLHFPGKKERYYNKLSLQKVKEWILGLKENKLVISLSQESELKMLDKKGYSQLILTVPKCQSFMISFKRTSELEKEEIAALKKQVQEMEKASQYEEEAKVWKKLLEKYGYYPEIEKESREGIRYISNLRKRQEEELAKIEHHVDNYKNPFLVESGKKKIQTILHSFPSLESKGKRVLEKLESLQKKLAREEKIEKARQLLKKGDFILGTSLISLKSRTLALALACYKEVVELKPDVPDLLEEAKRRIRIIEERLEREELKLLKY